MIKTECECCGTETIYGHYKHPSMLKSPEMVFLCDIYSNTFIANVVLMPNVYQLQGGIPELAKSLAIIANMLMDEIQSMKND